jgi:transcriptional regulator with XRE-family HTH domain
MNPHQQIAFYKQLGSNVRNNRKRLGLSQDELARAVGLTRTSLTNIENGRQHPPLHTFYDIVEQLNVDTSELLPRKMAQIKPVDVKAIAEGQIRGENELAFIASGIGINKEAKRSGDPKKKDRATSENASGEKRG